MKRAATRVWQLIVLGGAVSIAFGLFAVLWPGATLATLTSVFAFFVIVMGVVWFADAFYRVGTSPLWWMRMLLALVAIVGGVYLLRNPDAAAAMFAVLLAVYILVQALFDLVVASYAQKKSNKYLLIAAGLLGLVMGVVVMWRPLEASVIFMWIFGVYALVRGILLEVYAFRVRKKVKELIKPRVIEGKVSK